MRKPTSRLPAVYEGPAIFSYGFRPFFFFGSVYAAPWVLAFAVFACAYFRPLWTVRAT